MRSRQKILIVEDNQLVVKIISYVLEKEGFDFIVARDGNEGAESLETEKPDLILMDLVLPYRSGLEITSLAKEKNPNIPVIVVSSLGLIDETIHDALKMGVFAVVSKPFSPTDLMKKIKSALEQ